MKRLCLLLSLLLLLTGCGKPTPPPSPPAPPAPLSETVTVDIYGVNDLHGKLADTSAQSGVDELSTYLKQKRQAGNVILLAVGDMWQGAAESNLTGGFIVTDWMNQLGFAAMTLGGHEYDWGEEQIRRNEALAEFPFLAINIYDRATDQRVDYCRSSVVVEAEGVQIGIIGAIGNVYHSIASENTEGVYFQTGDALTALVKAEAEALRRRGVDFIVYALHDGQTTATDTATPTEDGVLSEYYDATLSDGWVDLVLEADTHYTYTLTDRHGVYHLQAGGNNNGISHARVAFNKADGTAAVVTAETLSSGHYAYLEDDPVVEQLLAKYAPQIGSADATLGTNGRYRGKDALCQLMADLYRDKGVERWGADYDIVLGGGYLSCRSPGYLPAGEVTYGQLLSLFPFDNPITLCSIRGRDLVSRFWETDNAAYYVRNTAYGDAVRDSIDPDGVYYVVTDTYSANYRYNRMTVVDTYAADLSARDLVAEYVAEGGLQS